MEQKEKEGWNLIAASVAGLMESLMSDLADNPPEGFTEEDIARHKEAARDARKRRNKLLGLTEKGGVL